MSSNLTASARTPNKHGPFGPFFVSTRQTRGGNSSHNAALGKRPRRVFATKATARSINSRCNRLLALREERHLRAPKYLLR